VVPLFALAFAGIDLSGRALTDAATSRMGVGILVSRVVGKPLGICLVTIAALWLGAGLPSDVRGRHVLGLGVVAGIPFTVSLYIAEISLPFDLIPTATAAVLLAAFLAGALGFVVLSRRPRIHD
jgi:Na+:H+ antiporter, NhaA family